MTPEPGDFGVVATSHGSLIDQAASWAIRWGTKSKVNHAVQYVGSGQIIEARRKVQVASADEYDGIIWSTGRLPAALTPSREQRARIVEAAWSYVDESYNTVDIAAIALAQHRLGHLVDGDEWWVKRLSDDHHLICSQLVDAAYAHAGIKLIPGRLSGLVSPGDLLGLLHAPVAA